MKFNRKTQKYIEIKKEVHRLIKMHFCNMEFVPDPTFVASGLPAIGFKFNLQTVRAEIVVGDVYDELVESEIFRAYSERTGRYHLTEKGFLWIRA